MTLRSRLSLHEKHSAWLHSAYICLLNKHLFKWFESQGNEINKIHSTFKVNITKISFCPQYIWSFRYLQEWLFSLKSKGQSLNGFGFFWTNPATLGINHSRYSQICSCKIGCSQVVHQVHTKMGIILYRVENCSIQLRLL